MEGSVEAVAAAAAATAAAAAAVAVVVAAATAVVVAVVAAVALFPAQSLERGPDSARSGDGTATPTGVRPR